MRRRYYYFIESIIGEMNKIYKKQYFYNVFLLFNF